VRRDRPADVADAAPFAIVVEGRTKPGRSRDLERVRAIEAAGATWWVESDWQSFSVDALRTRVAAGPPR
jgi:hypothetical protein